MAITALPTPPTRSDPVNFNSRADAFLSALVTFATEANTLQTDVNAKQTAAAASATAANASALASAASANVTAWVSGTTYAIGDNRYSPVTFLTYRRKTAGAGTTDPSSDTTNWTLINGTGDVNQTGTQTLTNKTLSTGSTWDGNTIAINRGGTGATTAATAFDAIKQSASETASGVVELASVSEVKAGVDTTRALTSVGLRTGLFNEIKSPISLSGLTEYTFTGIPSWATHFRLQFYGMGMTGTDTFRIALGNGSIWTSGNYTGVSTNVTASAIAAANTSTTDGWQIGTSSASTNRYRGIVLITRHTDATTSDQNYNCEGDLHLTDSAALKGIRGFIGAGPSSIDRIRVKTSGTNTFVANGTIVLTYW